MQRVAVVGGGSALARRLIPVLDTHYEVVTLGRSGCDVRCDLSDPLEDIHIPANATAVVHVAAAFGGATDEEMIRAVEVNDLGTLKVCMAARRAAVKHLVLISSLSAALTERSPYYTMYSITKRQSEELACYYCRLNHMLLTVLRPSQLYGEDDAFRRHQPFFYYAADRAEQGEDINLHGKHDALRNYIHADDVAGVVLGVLQTGCGGLYSCTFPRDVTLSEVASAALKAFGRGGRAVFREDMPDIPDNVFGNSLELYDRIGFIPSLDVWEGMRRLALFRQVSKP